MNSKKIILLILLFIITSFPISCIHNEKHIVNKSFDTIVEGKTNGEEVKKMLGAPIYTAEFSRRDLDSYLYGNFRIRAFKHIFEDDIYEVRTYSVGDENNILSYIRLNSKKTCVIVFDISDICVKKFYKN